MQVRDLARTRSGDKGSSANIGVIAYTEEGYKQLKDKMSAERVEHFFKHLGAKKVIRYELDNLLALNFVISDVLQGGGSLSLRSDSQGKGLGQLILEMPL